MFKSCHVITEIDCIEEDESFYIDVSSDKPCIQRGPKPLSMARVKYFNVR